MCVQIWFELFNHHSSRFHCPFHIISSYFFGHHPQSLQTELSGSRFHVTFLALFSDSACCVRTSFSWNILKDSSFYVRTSFLHNFSSHHTQTLVFTWLLSNPEFNRFFSHHPQLCCVCKANLSITTNAVIVINCSQFLKQVNENEKMLFKVTFTNLVFSPW